MEVGSIIKTWDEVYGTRYFTITKYFQSTAQFELTLPSGQTALLTPTTNHPIYRIDGPHPPHTPVREPVSAFVFPVH